MKIKKNYTPNFNQALNDYLSFLKKKNIYKVKNRFFYENNVEKLNNWNHSDFKKTLKWYQNIRKKNKTKVKTIHLEDPSKIRKAVSELIQL